MSEPLNPTLPVEDSFGPVEFIVEPKVETRETINDVLYRKAHDFAWSAVRNGDNVESVIAHLKLEAEGMQHPYLEDFIQDLATKEFDKALKRKLHPGPPADSMIPIWQQEIIDGSQASAVQTTPVVVPTPSGPEPPNHAEFPFPTGALYGNLGMIARHMKLPFGFVYPSLLTVACGLGIRDLNGCTRGTLYTANIGPVGGGKTVVTDRAAGQFFGLTPVRNTPASDRGLIKQVGKTGLPVLYVLDELTTMIRKCCISGSQLAPTLSDLWNHDTAGVAVKDGIDQCNGQVSILGNLPCADPGEFEDLFGEKTTGGLYHRFVYGIAPQVTFEMYTPCPLPINPTPCAVPAAAYEFMNKWVETVGNDYRRVGEIMLRVALIQSAMNGESEVKQESLDAARLFADWQVAIRKEYEPSLAKNQQANCASQVLAALKARLKKQVQKDIVPPGGTDTGDLPWGPAMNARHLYAKFGAIMINQTRQALVREGLITLVLADERVKFVRLTPKAVEPDTDNLD